MKWQVGILGAGYMGAIRRAEIDRRTDAEVVRVFDGKDSGWRALVDDPALDCIFVCLPNHLTCEAVCRALAHEKHVFAEKPPGLGVAEVRRMMAAESDSGRTLKFGFNHRYHPSVLAAERLLAEGQLGALLWLRGTYGKPLSPDSADGWRADRTAAGGGVFMDQGIHMLDLMRAFCGKFDHVKAVASRSVSPKVEDDLFAVLRSDEGPVASLHSTRTVCDAVFSLVLGLRDGTIELLGLETPSGRYGPERLRWRTRESPDWVEETFEADDSFARELDEFFACAEQGSAVRVGSTREALEVMTMVEAIYASAGWPVGPH